jgi:hypothetical protein
LQNRNAFAPDVEVAAHGERRAAAAEEALEECRRSLRAAREVAARLERRLERAAAEAADERDARQQVSGIHCDAYSWLAVLLRGSGGSAYRGIDVTLPSFRVTVAAARTKCRRC